MELEFNILKSIMPRVSKRHIQYFAFIFAALMFLAGGLFQAKSVKYIDESSNIEVEDSLAEQTFSKFKSAPVFFDFAIFSSASLFNLISFTLIFAILFSNSFYSKAVFNFSSRSPPFLIQ